MTFDGEQTHDLEDGPGYVVLRCRTCRADIARSAVPPHQWVHLDDEIIVTSLSKITKTYDHEAEPDVIDVGAPSAAPPAPPKPARQRGSNPFYS